MTKQRELDAILRNDFPSFVHKVFLTVVPGEHYFDNWHIYAIAYQLQCVQQGDIKRLLITLPPRSLKSIIVSVAYPAFLLGHDPTLQILCASYSQPLASKMSRDCRLVMASDWYKRIFPKTRLDPHKNTEAEFMTTRGGSRMACSVGGSITGRGGNVIILDDANKADDASSLTALANCNTWYQGTLLSRLNNKTKNPIIAIQQRLHEDDLAGHLLKAGGWTHLNLPAIAEVDETIPISPTRNHVRHTGEALHPDREPLDLLENMKKEAGSYIFAAQYQQRPVPLEGGMVKWSWFDFYTERPAQEPENRIVQSWDTACKAEDHNDYSVCTTWLIKKKHYYLLNVYRARLEYPDLLKQIKRHAFRYKAKQVLIEDKGAGTSILQELKGSDKFTTVGIEPKGDKQTRLYTVTHIIEGRRVLLLKDAPWLADFRHEMLLFPKGTHDDQVDSVSQFLKWADKHGEPENYEIFVVYSECQPYGPLF